MRNLARALLCISALFCIVSTDAGVYLQIKEIPGDATAKGFEKCIELESFSFGVNMPVTASRSDGGGATIGRAQVNELSITKLLDSASVPLYNTCAAGTALPTVILMVTRTVTANEVTYYKCTLSSAIISEYHISGDENSTPTEQVKLTFGKIEIEYIPIDRNGAPGSPIKGGWDFIRNRGIAARSNLDTAPAEPEPEPAPAPDAEAAAEVARRPDSE